MEGALNAGKLGLERVLVILEAPELVLSSPYITKMLFVDGSEPLVLLVATLPCERISDLLNMIRSLRSTSTRASAWKLSSGQSRFDGKYCKHRDGWNFDAFHWSTQIRKSESEIIVSDSSPTEERIHFTSADLKIIDELIVNFDAKVVVPRTRVRVPHLTDRVIVQSNPECAGNILSAWRLLPVTYLTRLQNLETSEKRVLQMAALPSGTSMGLIDALANWMSRIDDYSAYRISVGTEESYKADAMFNRRERAWKWNHGDFFDARSFSRMRREAERGTIPVDLA
jgi:hypothetical protein